MCEATWLYLSLLILQIQKPQPNYHSVFFLSHFLFISREITVLRQFLGVPSDAHTVGQRFHCHQVGGLQFFCSFFVCLYLTLRTYVYFCRGKPVTLCRCVCVATVSHCHASLSKSWHDDVRCQSKKIVFRTGSNGVDEHLKVIDGCCSVMNFVCVGWRIVFALQSQLTNIYFAYCFSGKVKWAFALDRCHWRWPAHSKIYECSPLLEYQHVSIMNGALTYFNLRAFNAIYVYWWN